VRDKRGRGGNRSTARITTKERFKTVHRVDCFCQKGRNLERECLTAERTVRRKEDDDLTNHDYHEKKTEIGKKKQ